MSDARDLFSNATTRLEHVIYVPGLAAEPSPEFKGFCEDLPEKSDHPLYATCPALMPFADAEDYPDPDEVHAALSGSPGFLIMAAVPYMNWHEDGSSHYSWGHYYTAWLYAPSEAEIATVATEWARAKTAASKAAAAIKTAEQSQS